MYSSNHLYNTKDVAKARLKLWEEQQRKCALTEIDLSLQDAVLDHNHATQYVRAVLHRQANAVLGKIENLWVRYLKWWYPSTLSQFLRQAADYLDKEDNKNYIHPAWIRRLTIDFKKLTETKKRAIIESLGEKDAKNGLARNKLFVKIVRSKKYTFEYLSNLIKEQSEC